MKSFIVKSFLLLGIFSFTYLKVYARNLYVKESFYFKYLYLPLDPGTINFSGTSHIYYNTDPGFLQQSQAAGGSGIYQYQWQISLDGSFWSDIPGSTSEDFDPGNLTKTTYYRRSVFDGSQTLITGNVLIAVCALMDPGFLTYNNPTILDNGTDPGFIQEYGGVGGDCENIANNIYQWESSIDGGNTWSVIPGFNVENYDPGPLQRTTSFRRKLSGGNQSSYTNTITIPVYEALDPGTLNYNGNVTTGSSPGPIPQIAASGGMGSPYNYVWERSTDGTNWSFVAFSESYDPGPLMQTTMFKRYVDDSHVSAISNTLTINVGVPLPLKFIYFNAKHNSNNIQLDWVTAQERNVKEFEIERSENGIDFNTIANAFFQQDNSNYSYLDLHPNVGSNYYRIKEVDQDRKIIFSKTIKVNLDAKLMQIKLKQNPVLNDLNLNMQSDKKQNAEVIISDALSKTIYCRSLILYSGDNNLIIDVKYWQKGMYFLQIIGINNRAQLKIIKI